jgi:hypothetical protein
MRHAERTPTSQAAHATSVAQREEARGSGPSWISDSPLAQAQSRRLQNLFGNAAPVQAPVQAQRAGVVQRELATKKLTKYGKDLAAKKGQPIVNLVKAIKEKLQTGGDAQSVEHVTQILGQLGVDVPKNLADLVNGTVAVVTLPAFQLRFHANEAGGGIDGYATAINKMTSAQRDEFPGFVAGLTLGTVFAQHDGSLIRNDLQNSNATIDNLQIQLGGKDLYIKKQSAKDKTSVTCVVVDKAIVGLCLQSPTIAGYVVPLIRAAHTNSLADGQKRVFTLDAEG